MNAKLVDRRRFAAGLIGFLAAPAIIRPASAQLTINNLTGFGARRASPPPAPAEPFTPTTFNPADCHTTQVLSNGNTRVTHSGGASGGCVRTIASRNTGKWYIEVGLVASQNNNSCAFGIGTAAAGIGDGTYPGSGGAQPSVGYTNDGKCSFGGPASDVNIRQGHTIFVAFDFDNKKAWIKNPHHSNEWNNDASADPETGANGNTWSFDGPYYIMWDCYTGGSNEIHQVHFGQGNFSGVVPNGYTAGFG